jgi:hypothetical protein
MKKPRKRQTAKAAQKRKAAQKQKEPRKLIPLPEKSDATISPEAYRQAIEKLGMSQVRAGLFFGLSDRQGQRLARGEAKMPPVIAHLLKMMIKYKVAPGDLDEKFAEQE